MLFKEEEVRTTKKYERELIGINEILASGKQLYIKLSNSSSS